MKRARWWLLSLALLRCGPTPLAEDEVTRALDPANFSTEKVRTCYLPCIGPVTSTLPISCADFAANLLIARDVLDEKGVVPRAKFCEPFVGLSIHVGSRDSWDDRATLSESDPVFGHSATLNVRGIHLVHELCHVWDVIHMNYFGGDHTYWDVNGYKAADMTFRKRARLLTNFAELPHTDFGF